MNKNLKLQHDKASDVKNEQNRQHYNLLLMEIALKSVFIMDIIFSPKNKNIKYIRC